MSRLICGLLVYIACLAPMLPGACGLVHGEVTLLSNTWTVTLDPDTLMVQAELPDGQRFGVSAAQGDLGQAADVHQDGQVVHWRLPDRGLTVTAELNADQLAMRFTSDRPGEITWPIIPGDKSLKAFILPTFEGVYAPTYDPDWVQHLIDRSPMDTTADLSMPFVGLDLSGKTLTYLFDNMFDNRLVFRQSEQGVSASVTHTFMDNWKKWQYTVIVELGDGSPIAPAKAYRMHLFEQGRFVTMAQKIQANPNAERLLGAPHAYLWDDGVFSHLDATNWKAFAKRLITEGEADEDTLGKKLWYSFNQEARDAAVQITQEQWPSKYLKSVIAKQISDFLAAQIKADTGDDPRTAVLGAFCEHFGELVLPYEQWGDGISVKMIDQLKDAGLDHMLLCLGDLDSADLKPQVAAHADEVGYLFGPYDSYHSIHPPEGDPAYDPNSTWPTAQFGLDLYHTGGIVRKDGSMSTGFKQRGYHLSPAAARPYVEKRVNEYMDRVPFTAVFVDCDAFGEFFDDYSPEHPATKQQDMQARLSRLDWLNTRHHLVVGSEGGSAFAAPVIHFAHGMFTPVIGWGDPDLTNPDSPYFLGRYWPPSGPGIFVNQVPLKPAYKKFYYDPRFRLPLYQTVFHDSVIATHHWGNASLKFKDQVATVALLEQLYNVPPLYHLNMAEFKQHRKHILDHAAFFSPLHRDLALEPITGFKWLSDDHRLQQTTFGDGTRIIVNFGRSDAVPDGLTVPARSALAIRPNGQTSRYTPAD